MSASLPFVDGLSLEAFLGRGIAEDYRAPADALPARTIADLLSRAGALPQDAARAAGVDVDLFEQVDIGRQPLPRVCAASIAAVVGCSEAEALVAARRWTADGSRTAKRPMPPDGLGGRPIRLAPLRPTVAPAFDPPPEVE